MVLSSVNISRFDQKGWSQSCIAAKLLISFEISNGTKVNVHVFDNGSNDHVDLIETTFPKTSLIRHHRNLGFSRGVNRILNKTSSPLHCNT
jgi:hypothetical protein